MKKGLKILGLSLGMVAIGALMIGGSVFADTSEEADVQGQCAGYGWQGSQNTGVSCGETVDDLLGTTPEKRCELRQEGNSLADIAAEQGITVDELVEAIMTERIAAIQAGVDDGTLTQEQADLMIQYMVERIELAVSRTTTGPVGWSMGGQNSGGARFGSSGMGNGSGRMYM